MSFEDQRHSQSDQTGTPDDRIGPGIRRAIRDVYAPDGALDERLEDLINQLAGLQWPPAPETN